MSFTTSSLGRSYPKYGTLIEVEPEDNHLFPEHVPERAAHHRGQSARRDMAVVSPDDDLRGRIVVGDPFDIRRHASVPVDLTSAHLHGLEHDARVLNGPVDI